MSSSPSEEGRSSCRFGGFSPARVACAGAGTEVTSAVGRSVTFQLPERDGEAAAWSFHGDVIVTVKFGDPPEAIFLDERYKPRWAFPESGRALTISQLTAGDAGTYTATVKGVKTTLTLRLYQEVPVPTVTCAAQNCSADGCRYTLRCAASGSGSGNVSYRWSMGEWRRSEGPMVLVEEMPSDEEPLTCTAQNPVSSRNVTVVSPAALCAGTHSSRKAGIVAAVVAGAGALFAAVLLLIYCVSKGCRTFCVPAARATDAEAEAEGMTVYAKVGPSQQVSLWSFPSAQHHDSKTPPIPDVETSATVYATVQAVAQTDDEKMGNGAPGYGERDETNLYSSVS
ncbi:SLAM family member 7-like [Chlamydotis macqueenii]